MTVPANKTEYRQLMTHIETFLQKATKGGGFDSLTLEDRNKLARLSALAETYEDDIPLMPIII